MRKRILLKKKLAPHDVHFSTRLVLTIGAIAAAGLHTVSPFAETVALAGTSICAAWAVDIERFIEAELDIN